MKKYILTITLFFLLFFGLISFTFTKKNTISITERRKLAKIPSFNLHDLHSGDYMNDLEKGLKDHFMFRDKLKNIKYIWNNNVFGLQVQNGQFIQGAYVSSLFYDDKQEKFEQSAKYYARLHEEYFYKAEKQFYSYIPNKDFYLDNNLPHFNTERTLKNYKSIMDSFAHEINFIDSLSINDYYYSDLHWKHENLENLAELVLNKMNRNISLKKSEEVNLGLFIGSDGRAISSEKYNDNLIYKSWEGIDKYKLIDLLTEKELEFYDFNQISSVDPYSLFLGGPQALISLESFDFDSKKDESLYLIRDSYASSFAPYLSQEFKRIVLVDMRYINSQILDRFINVQENDTVYYLNSLLLLSKPELLK